MAAMELETPMSRRLVSGGSGAIISGGSEVPEGQLSSHGSFIASCIHSKPASYLIILASVLVNPLTRMCGDVGCFLIACTFWIGKSYRQHLRVRKLRRNVKMRSPWPKGQILISIGWGEICDLPTFGSWQFWSWSLNTYFILFVICHIEYCDNIILYIYI